MNSKIKKIYFRFDAGGLIGFGHLGRVEAIADAFSQEGIEPIFIVRKRPSLNGVQFKYKVNLLKELHDVDNPNVITWINISEKNEADETLKLLSAGDLVFVDHYGLSSEFKKKLHDNRVKTISIADVTPGQVDDQFLINYNPIDQKEFDYYRSLNFNTKFLLGLSYVPLRQYNRGEIHSVGQVEKYSTVGVYLGGVSRELLSRFYDVIVQLDEEIRFEWIINSNEDLNYLFKRNTKENITFINRILDMVSFYMKNDLIIGACGVSFYERSFLGVPQLLVSVADNQMDICNKMVKHNLGYYIGDLRKDEIDQIAKQITNIDFNKLSQFQVNSYNLIDGNGAKNIVTAILREI